MQVWFYEAFEEEERAIRALLPEGVNAGFASGTLAEVGHARPPARLVSTRTQSAVPDAWFGHLDAVLSRSTGYDHLRDLRARGFQGALGYLPRYCHRSVAEHVLLAVLALSRRLPRQVDQARRFDRDGLTGREVLGRTAVVVGVGNIGADVVHLLRAVGMDVVGVDPRQTLPDVPWLDPEEALPRADVLVLAMDLNSTSRGWLTAERVALLPAGALVVNVARGDLAPSSVLLEGLRAGGLGGVALDVYASEAALAEALRRGERPEDPEALAALELMARPDVLCTPHNAFNTEEALARKAGQSVEQVVAWLERGAFVWEAPG